MNSRLVEILSGGLFVLLCTYLLMVPGRDVWSPIDNRIGEVGLLLVFVAVCAALGAIFSRLVGVGFENLLAGGIAVYVGWLTYLEATAGPFDSPVHILLGVLFLVGFGGGAKLVEVAKRRGIARRRTAFR